MQRLQVQYLLVCPHLAFQLRLSQQGVYPSGLHSPGRLLGGNLKLLPHISNLCSNGLENVYDELDRLVVLEVAAVTFILILC